LGERKRRESALSEINSERARERERERENLNLVIAKKY
jgi:hypothetical protein